MKGLLWLSAPGLAALVLAAHFYRAGNLVLAALALALIALLLVPRPWAARTIQACLVLGAAEWVLALAQLVGIRQAAGQPFMRLAAILGAVALVTALSALVFQTRPLRQRFGLDK
jgi:hypothetical protein